MLKHTLAWALGALIAAGTASADESMLRDDHPQRYTVQPGDTLWDISDRFLTAPWYWPEIWHENPDIDNPHLIYPGDVIRLTLVDGEPRLTVERGGGTVKLSPEVRVEDLDDAVATIPLGAIRPFLTGDRVVDPGVLEDAPYVVAGGDERVMSAAGDRVYARGMPGDPARDWDVVRREEAFVDPETGDTLGVLARRIGTSEIEASGDPATLRLTEVNREVLAGDRLLERLDTQFRSHFTPRAPDTDVRGVIMSVMDGVNQIGQFDVVAINRGASDGLAVGHVLAIDEKPRTVADPYAEGGEEAVTLPPEKQGELVVFRTFERMSLGLVMEATRAMTVGDTVRSP